MQQLQTVILFSSHIRSHILISPLVTHALSARVSNSLANFDYNIKVVLSQGFRFVRVLGTEWYATGIKA